MVERMNPVLSISQQCRLVAVAPLVGVPQAARDQRGGSRDYGANRSAVSGPALLRLASDGSMADDPKPCRKPQRVRRLMRLLGLVAICQHPNTSKPAAAHKIYPYLLTVSEKIDQGDDAMLSWIRQFLSKPHL
jgi:hypothetical protein